MSRIEVVQPEGWPRPKGYSNGMSARGRIVYVGGQIGWDTDYRFPHEDFVGQFGTTLDNVLAVVAAAGGSPGDVVKMTVFVTDLDAYRSAARELGQVWRDRFGKHFPAMALVGVAGLVDPRAKVEIEAIAVLPEADLR